MHQDDMHIVERVKQQSGMRQLLIHRLFWLNFFKKRTNSHSVTEFSMESNRFSLDFGQWNEAVCWRTWSRVWNSSAEEGSDLKFTWTVQAELQFFNSIARTRRVFISLSMVSNQMLSFLMSTKWIGCSLKHFANPRNAEPPERPIKCRHTLAYDSPMSKSKLD